MFPLILNYFRERFGVKMNQQTQKDKRKRSVMLKNFANPQNPMSDQDRVSPYNIYTIFNREVVRIYQNIK